MEVKKGVDPETPPGGSGELRPGPRGGRAEVRIACIRHEWVRRESDLRSLSHFGFVSQFHRLHSRVLAQLSGCLCLKRESEAQLFFPVVQSARVSAVLAQLFPNSG